MSAESAKKLGNAAPVVQELELPLSQTAPNGRPEEAPLGWLIESLVQTTQAAPTQARSSQLDQFLAASSTSESLVLWFGDKARIPNSKSELSRRLNRDVAKIDALLSEQVNAILHNTSFQKLEASWRGLHYLVDQNQDNEHVKIRVLSATWRELARDLERAIEFDQSQLFKKVYGEEFDSPGGEPFGVILGDYEIRHRIMPDHPVDDVSTLTAISKVAAAAFAPFIAAPHPSMFGLDSFTQLERPINLQRTFEKDEYIKWKAFRDSEDSRFVGLTMPRMLMRLPYEDDGSRLDRFRFREDVETPDRSRYLWGNAVYAFGAVLIRSFSENSWLANIRGVRRDEISGGLVTGLPVHSFGTDAAGVAWKHSTDMIITDMKEKEFADLGFIPLCACKGTEYSAFYSNQSVQKPKKYDEMAATVNARISAMLQYMLCVSRFAHYIKVIGRNKVGSFAEPHEVEDYLYRWLQNYVASDSDASLDVKAQYPLREGNVQIRERLDKPGNYRCVVHLRPHFQLDELVAAVRLVTDLPVQLQ